MHPIPCPDLPHRMRVNGHNRRLNATPEEPVASAVLKKARVVHRGDGVVCEAQETALEGTRGIHATGVKKMGGHSTHADKPYCMHAKHMYNLDRMKYQRVKMPIFAFTCFSIGVAAPVYVIIFQQRKTAST
ncbi:hypothetical protein GIB67_022704 [Kingdonia uniflora]|uniref:SLL1 protein n=1 Tax=Kingdonia uniflora TaxID=39325 RepID=A0A7J7P8U1_9MAGN|nr:hypothetical protein GIB67_022704 [Kingdonia uniflora]